MLVLTSCRDDDVAPTSASPSSTVSAGSWGAPPLPGDPSEVLSLDGGGAPSPRPDGPLSHVCSALAALGGAGAKQHVRILVMGDSHTRAELFTGTLRRALWERFPRGGPGFLYAGVPQSRHDEVQLGTQGAWVTEPKQPSFTLPFGDGMFGLGGVLARGQNGPLRVSLRPKDEVDADPLHWDVCYRLDDGAASFSVAPSGRPATVVHAPGDPPPAPLRHLELESVAPHHLAIDVDRGTPSLCGVTTEKDPADHPGLVLDAIGIDGAAYATPLAWDERAWASELRRRPPDLVILEYGTNEASDRTGRPEVFAGHLRSLVERIRRALPDASCLVVSPTDRSDRVDKVVQLHHAYEAAAQALGCYFWDAHAWMGGPGAMERWKDTDPPRARDDGIHLTEAGYTLMGKELGAVVLRTCGLGL